MIIYLPYDAPNWNDYINIERTNKYKANKLKQEEKAIINYYCKGKEYTGYYPVELIINAHFNSRRKDLDNVRLKGIIDGLVECGVIRNDNLNCIRKITLKAVIDIKKGLEIEIKEYKDD